MTGSVLVLNAGSSSLKYQVLDAGERTVAGGTVERVDETGWDDAFDEVTSAMAEAGVDPGDLLAVGHRVVHGGDRYTEPTLVDDEVERGIGELVALAPLHNPPALAGIRATRAAFPEVRQVAVFDTAFFAGLPAAAATYAVDREWPSAWASAGSARTASVTSTSPPRRPGSSARPSRAVAWSCCTSATAPPRRPSGVGRRWTPRWG